MSSSISSNLPNSNKTRTGKAGSLGIMLNHRPTSDIKASGTSKNKGSVSSYKQLRYSRQPSVGRLMPQSSTAKCLKVVVNDSVNIVKSKEHGECHYVGLMTCGNVWTCPICAAKISERRRKELKAAIVQHEAEGRSVLLITFTVSHQREESLQGLLERLSKASIWFYAHRTYKELKKRYMKRGRVRAMEVNHGQANGWHPHMHELWFLDLNLHDYSILKAEIFALWLKACKRFDLGLPSEEYGVDVRGGDKAASYVTKFGDQDEWGLESELSKSHLKKAKNGSRSPFQLIDSYQEGDKQAGALFIEYAQAFKGKRQLTWSRGLKNQFDLEDLTDEEIANKEEDNCELVVRVSKDDWYKVLKDSFTEIDSRLMLLQLAENGGSDAVNRYLFSLKKPDKMIH